MKFAEMSVVLLKNDVITTSGLECTDCFNPDAVKEQDAADEC